MLRKYLGNENSHTVFKVEVLGMSLAAKLIRTEWSVQTTMIGVNSQAVILATRSTHEASGHHLVDGVHEWILAALHKHRGLKVELRWIPGHMGVQENKWADEEAKKAAKGDSSDGMRLPMAFRGALPASRLVA